MKRAVVRLSFGRQYQLKDAYLSLRDRLRRRRTSPVKEFTTSLPAGFGAARATVRLSIPEMPAGRFYAFAEHACDAAGVPTSRVIATGTGCIAISDDLGETWRDVRIRRFARYPFIRGRSLVNGHLLLQAIDPDAEGPSVPSSVILLASRDGEVLHHTHVRGTYWHGPRAVDESGGTIMYSEYTPNPTAPFRSEATIPSRVWRSRDGGITWSTVFETDSIRHFHFLQARAGRRGEWWLTSGDEENEARIWRSTDDGESWTDLTERFGFRVKLGRYRFTRRIFRLTDLAWNGDDIVWGSDDPLLKIVATGDAPRVEPGARMFRWNPDDGKVPEVVGQCGPPVRSIVELPEHYVLITQGFGQFKDGCPRALLARKDGRGGVAPLFKVEQFYRPMPSFTHSRASRVAKDGVFFTGRSEEDVFDHPQQILRWEVRLD